MLIRQLAAHLARVAPPELAESYDNVGLLVGEKECAVERVVVALDLSEEVLDEAIELEATAILSHHPIWFRPRSRLIGDDGPSRLMLRAIRSGVALLAAHTNFDRVAGGVSYRLAERLALESIETLEPTSTLLTVGESGEGEHGSGAIGRLAEPLPAAELLRRIASTLGVPSLRHNRLSEPPTRRLSRVAVGGGACSFLLEAAAAAGADLFVTGDVTYHRFSEADDLGILLVDAGHYETEHGAMAHLAELLRSEFACSGEISPPELILSRTGSNPVHYSLFGASALQ